MTLPGSRAFQRLWPVALAACFLAVLPILASRHLPLLDAQGHESRLAVLRDILLLRRGSPFYDFTGFFLPDVAFDAVGLGLVGIVGPEASGQIFFGLTLILTLSGVWVLNRVSTGRWSLAPLAAALLLYNLITILGFFSYAFGFALVLWALAGWKLLDAGHPAVQALFGAGAAVTLLFCHIFDFGIYAAMIGGFVLSDLVAKRWTIGRAAISAASLVPALAAYGFMTRAANLHIEFEKNIVSAKLFGLAKSVTCASLAGDLAFAGGALMFAALFLISPRRGLGRGFAFGLAGLAVLYFVLPDKLASGSYVDKRMPIAFALLLLAGLDLHIGRSRLSVALVCLVGIAIVTKQAALAALWRSFDPVIDGIARPLASLPAGSVVLQAECEPDAGQVLAVYRERQPSLTHVPAMAAFDDSRFVAATWAIAGQHTVQVSDAYRGYYDLQESFGSSTCDAARYYAEYESIAELIRRERQSTGRATPTFFLLIRPSAPDPLPPTTGLLASGPEFALYAVK